MRDFSKTRPQIGLFSLFYCWSGATTTYGCDEMNKKEWNDWLMSIWGVLLSKLPAEGEPKNALLRSLTGWDFEVGMEMKDFRDLEIFKTKDDRIDFQNTMNFYKVKPPRGDWAKLSESQKTKILDFRSHMEKSGVAKYLDDHYPGFFDLVLRRNGDGFGKGQSWIDSIETSIIRRWVSEKKKKSEGKK